MPEVPGARVLDRKAVLDALALGAVRDQAHPGHRIGVLTETPAILTFVAQSFPAAKLAPLEDPFAFARVQSFNSYLCATVHVAHSHRMRGYRWAEDPAAIVSIMDNTRWTAFPSGSGAAPGRGVYGAMLTPKGRVITETRAFTVGGMTVSR